jgi:hypothetical protein
MEQGLTTKPHFGLSNMDQEYWLYWILNLENLGVTRIAKLQAINKMKYRINGISYMYNIISLSKRDKYYFSIEATYKINHRTSTITTVNPILSELQVPESEKRFEESVWVVTKKESEHLMKMAKELLSHRSYLKYFERILDEDRKLGEWENIAKISV